MITMHAVHDDRPICGFTAEDLDHWPSGHVPIARDTWLLFDSVSHDIDVTIGEDYQRCEDCLRLAGAPFAALDRTGLYVLNNDGEPVPCINPDHWREWYGTADRVIARDEIGGIRVSTVFLGIDHQFGHGIPILYETMTFEENSSGEWRGGFQRRYRTRAEALAGHQEAVTAIWDLLRERMAGSS